MATVLAVAVAPFETVSVPLPKAPIFSALLVLNWEPAPLTVAVPVPVPLRLLPPIEMIPVAVTAPPFVTFRVPLPPPLPPRPLPTFMAPLTFHLDPTPEMLAVVFEPLIANRVASPEVSVLPPVRFNTPVPPTLP
ncbi:hypothetical protein [Ralstonia mannitolilytica]|uniref:hypothetical protein n=1 Tax=Ralstonia mannitolilytica TaxID=105219 RepID=UPI001D002489|nr:hypothetical protein [Ralstonia mannitolilytica]